MNQAEHQNIRCYAITFEKAGKSNAQVFFQLCIVLQLQSDQDKARKLLFYYS